MAVRRAHHGNLDALSAQSGDTSCPFSFNCGPPFELEAELSKETNRPSDVIDDDSYVVHPLKRHLSNLQGVVWFEQRTFSCDADAPAAAVSWSKYSSCWDRLVRHDRAPMWPGSELETGARFGDSYQDPSLTSCPEAAEKLIGLKGTGLRVCVRTQFQVTALALYQGTASAVPQWLGLMRALESA